MPDSESLASRIRDVLAVRHGITEKKMFGGIAFLLHGNMCVGVWKTSMIARLGPEGAAAALEEPNIVEFDITGRPMKGWVVVEAEGIDTDKQLREWVEQAVEFVGTLPRK